MKIYARPVLVGVSTALMLAALSGAFAQKPKAPAKAVGFAKVEKVLKAKCVGCHQGAQAAEGINLSSYAMVKSSKYKGKPIVIAKNAKASVLTKALHGKGVDKMPPGGSLPPAEIKLIEAWIAAGAKK